MKKICFIRFNDNDNEPPWEQIFVREGSCYKLLFARGNELYEENVFIPITDENRTFYFSYKELICMKRNSDKKGVSEIDQYVTIHYYDSLDELWLEML